MVGAAVAEGGEGMARQLTCKQCGDTVVAEDDEALVAAAKEHFATKHKFLPVTEAKIREQVAESAVDV